MRSIASKAVRDGIRIAVEHLATAARLYDDDRDSVGHDIVELTGDPRPLLGHGSSSPFVPVALELDRAKRERALALPSQPDRHPAAHGPPMINEPKMMSPH